MYSRGYKERIAKKVALVAKLTPEDAKKAVEETLDQIIEIIATEGRIEIRGFGVISVKTSAARKARNPKTGAVVYVPERKLIRFKAGSEMTKRVYEKKEVTELVQ